MNFIWLYNQDDKLKITSKTRAQVSLSWGHVVLYWH